MYQKIVGAVPLQRALGVLGVLAVQSSTARRNSKFKIQNSKLRQSKRFVDFEWSVYLRRAVLVIIPSSVQKPQNPLPPAFFHLSIATSGIRLHSFHEPS